MRACLLTGAPLEEPDRGFHSMRPGRVRRTTAGIAVLSVIGALALSRDTMSYALITVLEGAFARPDIGAGEKFTGIVALGGNPDRIREAGRLARQYPHLRVIISGIGEEGGLLGEGIDPRRVLLENRSRNTYENALFTAALLHPKEREQWLLVTSAIHMPRAVGAFRKNGFTVEPWPIHDCKNCNNSVARHEWLGLAAYWVLGRSSALFPLPGGKPGPEQRLRMSSTAHVHAD